MDRQGKECDLKQDTEKAKRLFNVMESKDSSSREIQKDLCNVITLFNHSLTSWKKISGEEHFKVQLNRFFIYYIEKTLTNRCLKMVYPDEEQSKFDKVQRNRNAKFVQLCKELFTYLNCHETVIGGFIQARIGFERLNDVIKVIYLSIKNMLYESINLI